MSTQFKRIMVTGAHGFLGQHIVPALKEAFPAAEVIAVGRRDYDLLEPGAPARMFRDIDPDAVIHLAARVGGVAANEKFPADFFYQNLVMNTAVFHEAFKAGIKKFMTLIGGCSYPDGAPSPLSEDRIWSGLPYRGSAGYAVAKKTILAQSWAYRQQHGFNSVVLIPGNVYGEWDKFDPDKSHVIPALIRKYTEAAERNQPEVIAFGTGRPTRDFVYAGDVAALIPWFLEHYDSSDPVNISTGTRISIRDLTEAVRRATGFQGRINWDKSKPDGQTDKIYDVTRLHKLGLSCPTPLEQGLIRTVQWFIKARRDGTARL
jgi:GDP-L-fucose synthase